MKAERKYGLSCIRRKAIASTGGDDGEEKLDSARNIKFSLTKDTHLTAVFIAPTPTPMPSSIPYVLPYKVFSKTDIWDDIEKVSLAEAKAGTIVSIGNYEQDNDFKNGKEPIEWIVLEVRDGKAFFGEQVCFRCANVQLLAADRYMVCM